MKYIKIDGLKRKKERLGEERRKSEFLMVVCGLCTILDSVVWKKLP